MKHFLCNHYTNSFYFFWRKDLLSTGKYLLRLCLNYSRFQVGEPELHLANLLIMPLCIPPWLSASGSLQHCNLTHTPRLAWGSYALDCRQGNSLHCLCLFLRDHVYRSFKWFHNLCTNSPALLIGQKAACFYNKLWNLISASDIHGWVYLLFPWEAPQITPLHLYWVRAREEAGLPGRTRVLPD